MIRERRISRRLPLELCVHQVVGDRLVPGFTKDVSSSGLLLDPGQKARAVSGTPKSFVTRFPERSRSRSADLVQLELPLPGESDTLWMCGRLIHDKPNQGQAISFVRMAQTHRRWLREWLHEQRVKHAAGQRLVPVTRGGVRILRPPQIIC